MAYPAVRSPKKSYSIGRKRLVSWQLRRFVCPPYEMLWILRVFQELGIPLYFEAALLLTGGLRCRPQLPCGRHGHAVASGMF